MASLGNVVFIDRRIMDVAFLILLTHKNFLINIDIIPTDIEELLILGENSN